MEDRTAYKPDRCLDCGGKQSGFPRWHLASCATYQTKRRSDAAIRRELVGKIRRIANELDARYGNAIPGTAERALYMWFWPPSESTSVETLCYLLGDARDWLAAAPSQPAPGWRLTACEHAPISRRSTKPPRQRRSTNYSA